MPPVPTADQLASFAIQHKWIGLAALVIGLVVRLLKDDSRLPTVPARYRVWLTIGLGITAGVLERVSDGVSWSEALFNGLFAAMLAALGHDALIKSARGGKELPLPRSLSVAPSAASTVVPVPVAPEPALGAGQGIGSVDAVSSDTAEKPDAK